MRGRPRQPGGEERDKCALKAGGQPEGVGFERGPAGAKSRIRSAALSDGGFDLDGKDLGGGLIRKDPGSRQDQGGDDERRKAARPKGPFPHGAIIRKMVRMTAGLWGNLNEAIDPGRSGSLTSVE